MKTDPVMPHPPVNGSGSDLIVTSSGSLIATPCSPPEGMCSSQPLHHCVSHCSASGLRLYHAAMSVGCHIRQCVPCSPSSGPGVWTSLTPSSLLRKCRCPLAVTIVIGSVD